MGGVIIKPGLLFTGKPNSGYFTGRIQIVSITADEKYATVHLTKPPQSELTTFKFWHEEWLISSIEDSFTSGDYFEKTDWPDYPPVHGKLNHERLNEKIDPPLDSNSVPEFISQDNMHTEKDKTTQFNQQFSAVSVKLLDELDARIFSVIGAKQNGDMQIVFSPSMSVDQVILQLEALIEDLKTKKYPVNPPQTN